MKNFFFLLLAVAFMACGNETAVESAEPTPSTEPAPAPFAQRIEAATERLSGTDAGKLVLASIDAHGGLDKWYSQSPLYYHFQYLPTDDKTIRDSYILNDYVNARAVHTSANQEGVTYGFDGQDAWHAPADVKPTVSPRFWSLTPYYFVGLPFVLADEGINFEQLPDAEWEGTTYNKIKVTYEQGTGDADGDYYVLWINPETKQMDALNYIVSYPGFFKDEGHSPEKLMVLSGKTTVDGITLPTGYTTRWSDKPTEVITNIYVKDYEFRPDTEDEAFAKPAGAKVTTDLPGK
ncbi:hypothetical protein FUA23_01665 [Neolewinella aurantiaca]|uniref:Lipoprotein n=1 Tax=Neolewinella aurantiaca TaxID=2602767 RepID=A0A5C7G041_9BACT|nr:DUF6503 family protein [Neolewinella aurantiaca]TXF91430.1 hypothetical protein FUA23_01665 [Neolewinella aurantiaca]